MKKIALITDGWKRYVTYAWVQGYRRYASQYHLDTDLYVFQSFGNFNTDEDYNSGEYNITRLPDLRTFDGIILDLSNVSDASLKESFLTRVRESGVPAISLLEDLPGLYYSGLDNLTDFSKKTCSRKLLSAPMTTSQLESASLPEKLVFPYRKTFW